MQIAFAVVALIASWALLALDVPPVPTWFYVFAWYPTLVLLDGIARRLDGEPSLWARPARVASLFGWSAAIWLAFEAANFRLENWYYVSLPAHRWERWLGITVSFATVVPAIVLAERVLRGVRVFRSAGHPVRWVKRVAPFTGPAGAAMALGALLAPGTLFPLIWGAGLLIAEPFVYRRRPDLSLWRDLERGDWGRAGRLLLGGLGIGLVWETYNGLGDAGWIYTVPGLDTLRLFEMPLLGFLGFPFFALEAWSLYSALCAYGLAVPTAGATAVRRVRLGSVVPLAVALAGATLAGMERYTVSSTVPRIGDLPLPTGVRPATLREAGVRTVGRLAALSAPELAHRLGIPDSVASDLVETAALATLRGIGLTHAARLRAVGVSTRCDLAAASAPDLVRRLRGVSPRARPTVAEARVWTRAARHACAHAASAS